MGYRDPLARKKRVKMYHFEAVNHKKDSSWIQKESPDISRRIFPHYNPQIEQIGFVTGMEAVSSTDLSLGLLNP